MSAFMSPREDDPFMSRPLCPREDDLFMSRPLCPREDDLFMSRSAASPAPMADATTSSLGCSPGRDVADSSRVRAEVARCRCCGGITAWDRRGRHGGQDFAGTAAHHAALSRRTRWRTFLV